MPAGVWAGCQQRRVPGGRGTEVRGQEELSQQKGCTTLICDPGDSCDSVSLGILRKSEIRHTSQAAQVNVFQCSLV